MLEITSEESKLIEERLLKAVIDKLVFNVDNSLDISQLSANERSLLQKSTPDEIRSICGTSEDANAIIDNLVPTPDSFTVVAESSSGGAQAAVASIKETADQASNRGTGPDQVASQGPNLTAFNPPPRSDETMDNKKTPKAPFMLP